ncbi:MAG: glycosyltransferase [Actinomycetia bacterium]|nr:glycosyltransferase [Actinomycetes bacterium]
MHIVQLANFYGETSGGLRTAMVELASGYVARGHRVTRVVPGADDTSTDDGGVRTISVASPLVPGMGGYRAIRSASLAQEIIEDVRPDVIELSDKTTLAIAADRARRRGAAPVVLMSHERIDAILSQRVPKYFPLAAAADLWNRRLASRVDAVVCASRFAAQEFERIGASNIEVMPLGADLVRWHPGARTGRQSYTATIVMVGRLSAEKHPMLGIETIRELCRRGVTSRLIVAGAGPMLGTLVAASRGLPVEFVGHISDRDRLVQLVADADVALAPCPFETFGLSALEAMAAGTPIVIPTAGALPELAATGAARVVEGTGSQFADAVQAFLSGDRDIQRLVCRDRAEQFSWERAVDRMLKLFVRVSGTMPAATNTAATTRGEVVLV